MSRAQEFRMYIPVPTRQRAEALFLRRRPWPPDLRPIDVWHDSFTRSGMTHPYVWHASCIRVVRHLFIDIHWHSFIRVTWLIHTCDVTHSHMWHDSFTRSDMTHSYASCIQLVCHSFIDTHSLTLFHSCNVTHSNMWRDSVVPPLSPLPSRSAPYCWVTRLIHTKWHNATIRVVCLMHTSGTTLIRWHSLTLMHTCDVTHSHMWRDSVVPLLSPLPSRSVPYCCVTILIRTSDMTHSHVWHDSFIRVAWRIHASGITLSYEWHDSLIHETWLLCSFAPLSSPLNPKSAPLCCMTHSYVWHDSRIQVTWRTHTCGMNNS